MTALPAGCSQRPYVATVIRMSACPSMRDTYSIKPPSSEMRMLANVCRRQCGVKWPG